MKYEMDRVSIRIVKDPPLMSDKPITGPESAVEIISDYIGDCDREMMVLVNLRNDGRPINMNVMSIGTINASFACPREALKASILSNASSVMLFHNHPSGNLRPSREDITTTDKMIKAYQMLDIPVLDHIIIGPQNRFYSMREHDVFDIPCTDYSLNVEDLAFPSLRPQRRSRDDAR
ncbi:MAG: JAB domain-containing protein [Oscillospiraceae bacterium]|nr:JAB domain-containing protein [Oscillospiraceae bacterium]